MAVTPHPYSGLLLKALNKEVDFDTDTIKAMLTTGYTFDGTDVYLNDIGAVEVTGTGYTSGGATLASKTIAVTAANSWGTSRANSTAYTLGQFVRPATGNGFVYQAVAAGTSGGSVPTYPTTIGGTVSDGGVTWACVGSSLLVLDCADLSWSSSTISATGLVVYDSTGTSSTSVLLGYIDFGATVSSTAGTFSYTVDTQGLLIIPIA